MFDRFVEKARRVIFFARYEASQLGAHQIESEHLLLGLLREDRFLFRHLMPSGWAIESVRRKIEFGAPIREMVSTSVDMPLSTESKNVLTYAVEEADSLGDAHIETKHLLLGILREGKCVAAKLLHEDGVELSVAREILAADAGLGIAGAGLIPIPARDFIFTAEAEKTRSGLGGPAARNPFRGRTVEFLNEADAKMLAVTPGSPVPQVGSEVVLGEVRVRVTRVVYHYHRVAPTQASGEGNPFWPRKIAVYVQIIPE